MARCIRKKSRGGSSGLSKAQALVKLEAQERGYQKEVAKVRKWWLEALEEVEKIVQPEEKLIVWSACHLWRIIFPSWPHRRRRWG